MKNLNVSLFNKLLPLVLQFCCFIGFAQVDFVASIDSFPNNIELGGCPEATAFTLLGTTDTTASFSWNQAPGDIEGYSIDIFAPGADPLVDPIITFGGLFPSNTGTVEFLDPNTSYDAYIVTVCNPTGTVSGYVGPVPFSTDVLGVNEDQFSNITIYPNPVRNTLYISNYAEIDSIEIYNTQGQLVMSATHALLLDVSALRMGVYLAKMKKNETTTNLKFIKK